MNGFLDLPIGRTRFEVTGARHGTPLLMVHGATVGCMSFDLLAPRLADAGFRVLRFDLLGHGDSAAPAIAYDLAAFTEQARQLLAAADWPDKTAVLGYSLGAAITANLAVSQPGLTGPLVLAAPLLNFSGGRLTSLLLRQAYGDAFLRWFGLPYLRVRRHRRYRAIGQPAMARRFVAQTRSPAFQRTLLSMERNGTLGDHRPRYAALGNYPHPLMALGAAGDRIVPPAHFLQVCQQLKPQRQVLFPGLEHNFILTGAEALCGVIKQFLVAGPADAPGRWDYGPGCSDSLDQRIPGMPL